MPETKDLPDNGLVCGYVLDGKGGAREIESAEIDTDFGPGAVTWLHFDFTHPGAREWIQNHRELSEHMARAMLADDSRPRCMVDDHGILTVLRGINMNPGAEMEDMISIRVWMCHNRIISTRRRKLKSILAIRSALEEGTGPTDPASFLVELISLLGVRIGESIDLINDQLDEAEARLQQSEGAAFRSMFGEIRRQAARIRRYLAPQREALDRLSRVQSNFFDAGFSLDIYEQSNWMTLFIEDLDLARERAMVAQEEMLSTLAHEQNSKMFILSIVAAIFLPLAFFTGLMGMNVAGLPGTVNPWSFYIVLLLMFAAAGFIMWLFKRKRWF
jgi:zinc transporter